MMSPPSPELADKTVARNYRVTHTPGKLSSSRGEQSASPQGGAGAGGAAHEVEKCIQVGNCTDLWPRAHDHPLHPLLVPIIDSVARAVDGAPWGGSG